MNSRLTVEAFGKGDRATPAAAGLGAPFRPRFAVSQCGIRGSASLRSGPEHERPRRPWENGKCESFLKTLKEEELDGRTYSTMEEVAGRMEEFIEQIHNPVRLHPALTYQSPVEFEQQQALENAKAWMPAKILFRGIRKSIPMAQNH
jgi:hypothetical protein